MLDTAERASQEPSKPPPLWVSQLRQQVLSDEWEWIISTVADGVPSQIDYVNENWTHMKIAREYARLVARANS